MDERREQIEAMYRDGFPYSQIAKKFGLSRQRIAQIIFPDRRLYKALQDRAELCCEECDIHVENGHAHHLNTNPNGVITSLENLVYLCPSCHRKFHKKPESECMKPGYKTVKIPDALHKAIRIKAEKEDMSIEALVAHALDYWVHVYAERKAAKETK
jgi:hypothetical protein